jgi:hypothetical protein
VALSTFINLINLSQHLSTVHFHELKVLSFGVIFDRNTHSAVETLPRVKGICILNILCQNFFVDEGL